MSKLDELIAEFCPNGVEYISLSEIATISIGEFVHKNKQNPQGEYPVYNGGITNTGFYDEFNNTSNKIIISARGANAGYINRVFTNYWSGNSCYTVAIKNSLKVNWNYIYYVLKNGQTYLTNDQQKGGIPAVSKKQVENFPIPLPPLSIQEEIVRILDNFTELTEELIEEIAQEFTARKQQYGYYRDRIFNFGDEVEWKTLGEVATDMYRGSGIKRDQVTECGIPCVRYGEIYTTYDIWFDSCVSHTIEDVILNKKYFEYGDVLFAITGESVEEIAKSCVYVGHEKCLAGGDLVVMKHNENPKYLSYALSTTDAQMQKSKGKVKSKVVHSSVPALKEIKIPIPTLAEQERIVEILDHFDSLVDDITKKMTAEIEARQKQYEYYRDKLLTFKEIQK